MPASEWNLEDAIAVAKEEGREEERNTIFNLWRKDIHLKRPRKY